MIAQNIRWAENRAAYRLGLHGDAFWERTPVELARAFWCERQRRNVESARWAWLVSWLIAPHVSKSQSHLASARRIIMSCPGFDPDPEDIA